MPRKYKFDPQWEQALSLLGSDDAAEARRIIENYQATGLMPENLDSKFQMILLLVQPSIDRRRRAALKARERRQRLKGETEPAPVQETPTKTPTEPIAAVCEQPSAAAPARPASTNPFIRRALKERSRKKLRHNNRQSRPAPYSRTPKSRHTRSARPSVSV